MTMVPKMARYCSTIRTLPLAGTIALSLAGCATDPAPPLGSPSRFPG
jgi:hypothetical protein